MDKFQPGSKVLVIDFDHTCYDTDNFLLAELREPMLQRWNIPPKKWEESYERAAEIGYTPEMHLQELGKIMNPPPCSTLEIMNFASSISFDKYLFPDTMPILKEAKEKGYKIMMLSFGDKEWQDRKVFGSGLDKIADVILYVALNGNGAKADKIKEYAENSKKIIFVDNNGKHLDEIKKIMPEVETYFINRVSDAAMLHGGDEYLRVRHMESRKIAERRALPVHKRCSSLREIIL